MRILYDSRTGNVKKFAERLGMDAESIDEVARVNEPFVLISYTTGKGLVPKTTEEFCERNKEYLVGVASSGNRNWGILFARCAEALSEKYRVPIVLKFELFGTPNDIVKFKNAVEALRTNE